MTGVSRVGRRGLLVGAAGAASLVLAGESSASARFVEEAAGVRPSPVGIGGYHRGPILRAQLADRLEDYLEHRVGTVGVAVYDRRTDVTFTYRVFRNETLSTIKVVILVALLRRAEALGRELTSTERDRASRMIRYSDNSATDALLAQLGVARVQNAATWLGMRYTHVQGLSSGWWGYSTTWPGDLVRAMNKIVWGGVLTSAHRSYIRSLMAGITSSQRWGVCDPPLPTSLLTQTKNGWGPMSSGFRLNSVGHVKGNGRNYTMAILSRSPYGYTYGRDTVDEVARIVYRALWRELR